MVNLCRSLLFSMILLVSGCAYYNTFYNARESYRQAVEMASENPDNPLHQEKTLLDAAITGAGRVLARYPESRWVDDAQLLLGDAFLLRGKRTLVGSGTSDFEQAVMSYSSVIAMTGNHDMADRARLGMGRASMELGRHNDAAASFLLVSSRNGRRHTTAMLLLCEAYLLSNQPELAFSVFDTLVPQGGDSLAAEYFITGGRILAGLGMPDSGAVVCLRATEIVGRGSVFHRALTTAAECYIEAGMPERASAELNRLLTGYRSDREMADINLLKGRADELAGNTSGALAAYLSAAELDTYRETGAEALYRRALLLEETGRYEEALEELNRCSSRPGGFMWIRLASGRFRDLSLYRNYRKASEDNTGETGLKYGLLALEKRLDLYGGTDETLDELRQISQSGHPLFSSMALVLLAENGGFPEDSLEAVLMSVLDMVPRSDLAGNIEDRLGLPRGRDADNRPGAVLERAWNQIEQKRWNEAWETLSSLLREPESYEVRAEALWAAYIAAEGARKDAGLLNSYLSELTSDYPDTPEGAEAGLRRAIGLEQEDPEGE
jgi:tetratricopeptide (TPR) repeat protein